MKYTFFSIVMSLMFVVCESNCTYYANISDLQKQVQELIMLNARQESTLEACFSKLKSSIIKQLQDLCNITEQQKEDHEPQIEQLKSENAIHNLLHEFTTKEETLNRKIAQQKKRISELEEERNELTYSQIAFWDMYSKKEQKKRLYFFILGGISVYLLEYFIKLFHF